MPADGEEAKRYQPERGKMEQPNSQIILRTSGSRLRPTSCRPAHPSPRCTPTHYNRGPNLNRDVQQMSSHPKIPTPSRRGDATAENEKKCRFCAPKSPKTPQNSPKNRKTRHFRRKNINFLDSNASTKQNEGVEQGAPPYGAQGAAGDR